MLTSILSTVICNEVTRLWPNRDAKQAMLIRFSTFIDWDQEDGYRGTDLLIYAPCNYIQVWDRTNWNVNHFHDNEAAPAGHYKGESDWHLLSDHDSCWRQDGVQRFIQNNQDKLQTFRGTKHWYSLIDPPAELAELKRQQRR